MTDLFFNVALFLVVIILNTQFLYFAVSGEFVSALALSNINQAYLLVDSKIILYYFLSLVIAFFIAKDLKESEFITNKFSGLHIGIILLFCLIVVAQNGIIRLPNKVKQYLIHETPVFSLVRKSVNLFCYNNLAKKKDYTFDYKYIKNNVYKADLSYKKIGEKKPNIILIFTEGTSARLIGTYNKKYTELTPNIDNFAKNCMQVYNYYNHTAATFRGTHGQLASCYPVAGGYGKGHWADGNNKDSYIKRKYQTLPNILNSEGYITTFLSPHLYEDPYTSLLKMLCFDKVVVAEDYQKLLGRKTNMHYNGVTDSDMYDALIATLENQKGETPFFLSMYTFGTHTGIDVPNGDDNKYKDGKNSALNTLKYLDRSFGKFYNYFMNSRFKNNTIVIFTSDHAHYYEKPYVELVREDGDYKRVFIDKVPLLIFDKTRLWPSKFDAKGSTSVDLTPSILHMVEINSVRNSFLGKSIFECTNNDINVAAMGNEFFLVYNNMLYLNSETDGLGKDIEAKFSQRVDEIIGYYNLEKRNKVFK